MSRPRHGNKAAASGGLEPGRSAACSDAELVHGARCGDKRAFVEIVARHQAMVCGMALGILGDVTASEDAGQEAFLTAWRKIHELRDPEKLRPWLGQIARHAALGYLRRQRGHDRLEEATDLPDESPAPDEITANEEEASLVMESLGKLPKTYRLPMILFYRDGKSARAVADALAISEDAVRQRLARGREMLRDRISGLVENVLTRTGPTPVFTMAIAAAIGALVTPAAVASGVFTATAAAGTTSTAPSSTSLFAAINASKTTLFIAAATAALCVPAGYHIGLGNKPRVAAVVTAPVKTQAAVTGQATQPSYEGSAIFAEWKRLHDTYGTTAGAMPRIYDAIAVFKDPFRRRAFRSALIAEWVQVDPTNGLAFFMSSRRGIDAGQRQQFFEEWLARDAKAAVEALMASGKGWEEIARASLLEIARRAPGQVAALVAKLPKSGSYQDPKVRDAFARVAEGGLAAARVAAEAMDGPNRNEALAGVARAWARNDLNGAIAWARQLAAATDREEIIRAALTGAVATDPASALDRVSLVPPGGRPGYFASTTGARVLKEAASVDFDAAVGWLAAHPGRLGREDLMGLASAVAEKLNADPPGFLMQYTASGSLAAMLPAITNALFNESSGQRAAVWDWLKTQPDDETASELKRQVLRSAAYQDPALAVRLVADLPRTTEGDAQVHIVAESLFDDGLFLHRLDKLLELASERLRQPLVERAFNTLRSDTMTDPQHWIARLSQLPETSRVRGIESIARAWAEQAPEASIGWVTTLPAGEARVGAVAAIASTWAAKDFQGASVWVAAMPAGMERDRSAQSLVFAIAAQFPREAWEWAVSIGDAEGRAQAATHAAKMMAARDPAAVRQWLESGPLRPEARAALLSALETAGPGDPTLALPR